MKAVRTGFPPAAAVLALHLAACGGNAPADETPPPGAEAVAGWRMVDLSHAYGRDTVWPTDTVGFRLDTLAEGRTPGGWFYAAKRFETAEHGGTHLDAPFHFAEGGADAASIPLDRLVLPGIVIDVSAAAAGDPDHLVRPEDVLAWERTHGRVPAGAAVLIRTGWAARWPDPLAYLGDDTPGETGNLRSPASAKRRRGCWWTIAARVCWASTRPASTAGSRPTSSPTASGPRPACPTWRTSRTCPRCRRPASCSPRCR